jgi:hypothetical protein
MAVTTRATWVAAAALALAAALAAPAAFARDPLVGMWEGRWSRPGGEVDLAMEIRPGAPSNRYAASLSSRGMHLDAVPFASALHDGCCGIRLVLRGAAAATHFRATVQGGELRGTSAEDGGPRGTFVLHRVSQPREEG